MTREVSLTIVMTVDAEITAADFLDYVEDCISERILDSLADLEKYEYVRS